MLVTWKIDWMKSLPKLGSVTDYVVECGWRCTGVQEEHTGTVYASCAFTPPANPSGNVTPYDQLTEAQVLGWVWSSGVDKDAAEAAVKQQIDNQINPPVVQRPLPWDK